VAARAGRSRKRKKKVNAEDFEEDLKKRLPPS
jgi:hypothetical protein